MKDKIDVQIDVQIDDEFQTQVDELLLRRAAEVTLSACNVDRGALTIVVTNDDEIRTLNRDFRNVDAATDVLSFPNTEAGDTGTQPLALPPELLEEDDHYLGDIVIAYPYIFRQAEKYGVQIETELRLMTVHGVLHLLGYDHASSEEEAEMWQLQAEILSQLGDKIDLEQRSYDE